AGDTKGSLVNKGDARCIEIWNLVFIQFNANPDGTFSPLPAKHVDTGMGFERVTGIMQGTKNFQDFAHARISNYETDIFRPLFDALEKLSGKKYGSTLPSVPGSPTVLPSGEHTRPRVLPTAPPRSAPAPCGVAEAKYSRRNLPHFERPWAKYMVTFSTLERRQLAPAERDIVLKSILHAHEHKQCLLYAACVMPDHVHLLFEPQIEEQNEAGQPVFWSVRDILQRIKSASAHNINRLSGQTGHVWEQESLDRMIRGQSDMEEKFHYICRNPWESGAPANEDYPWLWTQEQTPELLGEHTRPRVLPTAPSRSAPPLSGVAQVNFPTNKDAVDEASTAAREGACAPRAEQEKTDIAFRVIADHIRTLAFSIADGILPANTDRNYVLRRILRRAVRYGRTLGFHEPFFYKLVDVLAETMGDVFPEIRKKQSHVQEVIKAEEEAFNKTLDNGIEIFEDFIQLHEEQKELYQKIKQKYDDIRETERQGWMDSEGDKRFLWKIRDFAEAISNFYMTHDCVTVGMFSTVSEHSMYHFAQEFCQTTNALLKDTMPDIAIQKLRENMREKFEIAERGMQDMAANLSRLRGGAAFTLYDTYGFPLDLTELMARERGLTVDTAGFERLMDEQRARARAAQKKEVIAASNLDTSHPTDFVGFDRLTATATVQDVVKIKGKLAVLLDHSPLYAEMGGQVGDTGEIQAGGKIWRIANTQRTGNTFLHLLADKDAPEPGAQVELRVNAARRAAIQRHHTVTHLLHWALHEVVSPDATQKGSYVGPEKLTFDFSSAALTPAQVADVEKLVNERILDNAGVTWTEVPYAQIKGRKEVMQFFGEKYGDIVRVVQIGGATGGLDGYSMELCGGTHTRATGEIGLFRIVGESAIAAGIRRIEAVAGLRAYEKAREETTLISTLAGKVNSPVAELEKKLESLLSQQKAQEKQLKAAQQKQAAETARGLLAQAQNSAIIENLGPADGDFLQAVADALKSQFKGVVVLGGSANGAVALIATVSPDFTAKFQAGKIIQAIAPLVGGK
ncbi:MAG: alanine--tRNA ligase-related protein, partial [Verrucomicrobiota bacterium]